MDGWTDGLIKLIIMQLEDAQRDRQWKCKHAGHFTKSVTGLIIFHKHTATAVISRNGEYFYSLKEVHQWI